MTEFLAEFRTPTAPAQSSREAAGARPRVARSRAAGLAGSAAVIALLAAGCSSGGQPKAGASSASGQATGIQVPGKIGSLTKYTTKDSFDDTGGTIPKSVLRNLRTVGYAVGGDSQHSVTVSGGPGLPVPSDGSPDKVMRLFSQWDVGSAGAKLASIPPGPTGGTAECTPYDAQYHHLDCGWVSGKVSLVISFLGFKASKVRTLVPQILSAMVTR